MWQTLIWFRNVFCVFTFVALWHDMTLQLLVWGWLSAIAFVPEALVEWLGSLPMIAARIHEAWWLPNLIALLGAVNVLLLIVANMLGFATAAAADGLGAAGMLSALTTWRGLLLLGGATIMLCVAFATVAIVFVHCHRLYNCDVLPHRFIQLAGFGILCSRMKCVVGWSCCLGTTEYLL